MDSENDPIKAFLETTGFTCDDLLQKLLQYKNQQKKPVEKPDEPVLLENTNTSESDNHVDTTSGSLEEPVTESRPPSSVEEQGHLDKGDSSVHHNDKNEENAVESSSLVSTEESVETTTGIVSSLEDLQKKSQRIILEDESKTTDENSNDGSIIIPHQSEEREETNRLNFQDEKESNENENSVDSLNENHATRRKSISNELVKKLTDRLKSITSNESSEVETSESDKIGSQDNNPCQENDIEVCQLPDVEFPPSKPLIKLRSDLFENNSKGNFTVSDNEDDDENNDPEVREFLKNIVEVTSEVKDPVQKTSVPKNVVEFHNSKIRKVKLGFVKKRILIKAIERPKDVEHERNEHSKRIEMLSPLEKSNNDEYPLNRVSEEEVRENLKLQLCSLRNRKKTEDLLKDKSKINNSKKTYEKKKALEVCQITSTTIESEDTLPNISSVDNSSPKKSNDPLFSLSEDTDFMIVDVQGGVELVDVQEQESAGTSPGTPSDIIKLTKTKDVTKIKGWKNKKFKLDDDIVSTKKAAQHKDELISNNETVECGITENDNRVVLSENSTINKEKDIHCESSRINTKEVVQRGNTTINKEKDGHCETNRINTKETLKSKKTQVEDGKEPELSPFVSDTLEEFLTDNSTLNISYSIPKLGAEEAINSEKYNTVLLPQNEITTCENTNKGDDNNVEKSKGIKPKTLAEKRRMLESNKTKPLIVKTFNKSSFVIYNGKKVYVPTMMLSEKCLEVIKFTPNLSKKTIQASGADIKGNRRLTLLDDYRRNLTPVTYKPGPLREKMRLQNQESIPEWRTEIQKLPTVKLKIIPEIGKPVPPPLMHLFKFGPKIEEERLEFALSALVTNKPKKQQGFTLTVPYANKQKYILVRKENVITSNVNYDIPPERNSVKCILDDIINYVEHKENEESIIRDAEEYVEHTKPEDNIQINKVNFVRKSQKRMRLEQEFNRLSCKVLSVSVDDSEVVEATCQKPFCRFGCLCKSLSCAPQIPVHCSKLECMFECSCENISLEGGTLSCDAVTRLEDRAKRNLARVEKEFTQTVILQTDDQPILIPSSDRNKSKRTKRIPKRFSHFFEKKEHVVQKDSRGVVEEVKECEVPSCVVKLKNLDLKGIVPLCLYHDCYNCSCLLGNGKRSNPSSDVEDLCESEAKKRKLSVEKGKNGKRSNTSSDVEDLCESKAKKRKLSVEKDISTEERGNEEIPSNVENQGSTPSNNDSDADSNEGLTNSRRNKYKEGCARALGVHPEIVARNEIPFYKKKLRTKVTQAASAVFFDTTPLSDLVYVEPLLDEIDVTTPMEISAADRLKLFLVEKSKKVKKILRGEKCDTNLGKTAIKQFYVPVFEGEIIVPIEENKDFVKKLGVKTADPYIRLLPWKHLLENYHKKLINIWCPTNSNRNMILNLSSKQAPVSGYVEMKDSKRRNGITNWILSGTLPNNTPSHLVHLILSPKNGHFEISGICLKNISDEQKQKGCILEEKKTDEGGIKKPVNTTPPKDNASKTTKGFPRYFTHKDRNNESNQLTMQWRSYPVQKWHPVLGSAKETKDSPSIDVRLTAPISLRFRMMFLNSNFTFLLFKNSDYSIKYTDLMQVVKISQERTLTIYLHCAKLSSGYTQPNFGIYAVPGYADVLFIGPYKMDEEHGLQTLRYLKQELVPTEYFEMVQGGSIPDNRKDRWLWSSTYFRHYFEAMKKLKTIRDNIGAAKEKDESNEYAVITPLPSTSMSSTTAIARDVAMQYFCDTNGDLITSEDLVKKPFIKSRECVILNDKRLRERDYNIFLVTDIKDFGYLGAVKQEYSKAIEVAWPVGNKVLRFINITDAFSFIKRRLTNLLLPVPASYDFKIFAHLDVESIKGISKVDPIYLNGTHLCGSFGVVDSRKLTPELALSIGTTQEDVLNRLAKRAQYLGAIEIQRLKEQEASLVKQKKELMLKKQAHLRRYMHLLKSLPEQERLKEYSDLMKNLRGEESCQDEKMETSNDMTCPEGADCIEIEDSESEEPSAESFIELSTSPNVTKPESNVATTSILKPKVAPQTSAATSPDSEVPASILQLSTSPNTTKPESNVAMASILKPKIAPQTSAATPPDSEVSASISQLSTSPNMTKPESNVAMTSILKTKVAPQTSAPTSPDSEVSQPVKNLKNFRLVKTSSGKVVFMRDDNSGVSLSKSLSGMKLKIKNNKVIDVPIEGND